MGYPLSCLPALSRNWHLVLFVPWFDGERKARRSLGRTECASSSLPCDWWPYLKAPKASILACHPSSNASLPHEIEKNFSWKWISAENIHVSRTRPVLDRLAILNTLSPKIVAIKGGKYKMSNSRILDLSGRKVPVVYRYVQNKAVRADVFNRCGFLQETRIVFCKKMKKNGYRSHERKNGWFRLYHLCSMGDPYT